MTDPMKPIETTWRGYRFRSRTQARWAVFLTAAGIRFEYEAEGYTLPSGWYLPDFWLPERKEFLEIKGQEPTERERRFAAELRQLTGNFVLIAVGAPDPNRWEFDIPAIEGPEGVAMLDGPSGAYAAARAERFDGRPTPPPQRPTQLRRLWRW